MIDLRGKITVIARGVVFPLVQLYPQAGGSYEEDFDPAR